MNKFLLCHVLVSCFLTCLFLSGPVTKSEAAITYKAKKGDSYYKIAEKYHVSVSDLKKANRRAAREIKPGDKIIIPSEKKRASRKTASAVAKKRVVSPAESTEKPAAHHTVSDRNPAADKNVYHVVKKGDSLSSLSRAYSVSITHLREMNNLKRSAQLRKGAKLLVKAAGPKTYTVKKGDNIWKIAGKYHIDAEELMEINNMDSTSLKIGQKIYLEEEQPVLEDLPNVEVLAKRLEEELQNVPESDGYSDKNIQEKLTLFAKKLLDIPYRFGGNSILGIDCSAYVKKVYGFLGMELPRTAREQFNEGEPIDREALSIGDLVFFRTYASFPSHVGIYLGNNLFIHASSRGKKVKVDNLDAPYYLKRFIGAKRLLEDQNQSLDPQS